MKNLKASDATLCPVFLVILRYYSNSGISYNNENHTTEVATTYSQVDVVMAPRTEVQREEVVMGTRAFGISPLHLGLHPLRRLARLVLAPGGFGGELKDLALRLTYVAAVPLSLISECCWVWELANRYNMWTENYS